MTRTIQIQGQTIYYADSGAGEAVLLLHGWGTDHQLFEPLIRLLAQNYRVIAPDFPGFGQSPEPKEPWHVDDYADCVLALLKELRIESCSLVGHSFGGRVIIKLAARQLPVPRIPRIVLIGAAGVKPAPTRRGKRRARQFKAGKALLKPFPRALEALRRHYGSADYAAASPNMRQVLSHAVGEDLTPLLERIQPPTLLIWGRGDTATPLSDARLMEQRIPGAGLVILEDAGHYAFLERQAQFLRVMGSFFSIQASSFL
ncbi:MAG: alpha/beta fold hydrolase [Oscillospiraceae bacterium]|nr:alpha/beta fold hydrolase [Oscillospiraceae bacterium]